MNSVRFCWKPYCFSILLLLGVTFDSKLEASGVNRLASPSVSTSGLQEQQPQADYDADTYEHVRELSGVTILGTGAVDESYLDIAAEIYQQMTSRRDPIDIPSLHRKSDFKILLIGESERFSKLPEYEGQGREIDRAAGLGGQIGEFFIGVKVGSPHALVHELGHGIYHSGIQFGETNGATDEEKWYRERVKAVYDMSLEKATERHGSLIHEVLIAPEGTFSAKLATAWRNAKVKKLWEGTYAGSEPNEYWAEGVTMWFRAYSDIEGDSREYLKEKDELLYELCASIFPDDDWTPAVAVKAAEATVPFSDRDRQDAEDEFDSLEEELEAYIKSIDLNGDGKIQLNEIPEENHVEFQEVDVDSDGSVTCEELIQAMREGEDEDEDDEEFLEMATEEGAFDLAIVEEQLQELNSAAAIKENTAWNLKEMRKRCDSITKNEQGYFEAKFADGHVLIFIPQGSFPMGTDTLKRLDKPQHEVGLTGYWIAKYLVTNKQFAKFVKETGFETDAEKQDAEGTFVYDKKIRAFRPTPGRNWKNAFDHFHDNYPVVGVSWYDGMEYSKWLGKEFGLPSMSLPTEAQWEKAARGTDERRFPWGDDAPDATRANYCDAQFAKKYPGSHQGNPDLNVDDGYPDTSPVDAFPKGASPYGVFDMGGNVSNWIFDFVAPYPAHPVVDPVGPGEGEVRGMRGGFWVGDAGLSKASIREQHNLRSECRSADDPFSSDDHLGFRFAVQFDGPDLYEMITDPRRDTEQEEDVDEEDQDEMEDIDDFFDQIDQDGDGKIQRSEVGEENHSDFDEADANGDGVVTRQEFRDAFSEMGDDDGADRDGGESEGVMTELYYGIGNSDADVVIVNTQGGPMPSLLTDEFAEVFSGVDLDNAFVVNVHQSHTKNQEKVSKGIISFEEAKTIDEESVAMLAQVVDGFLKQEKRVYVVGISFGAWMVQDLLATQGSVADGYVIVVGRLDMPDVIWKSFSQGGSGYFEDGVNPVVEEVESIDESKLDAREIAEFNMAKVAAGLGHKRYTKLLKDVDLSKVHYLFGKRDEPVGRLSDAEIKFLESKDVNVIVTDGGHGSSKLDEHMYKILNGFIDSMVEEAADQKLDQESSEELTGEAREILALLDLNDDGKLQMSELEGDAREWLEGIDENRDGVIAADELAQISGGPREDLHSELIGIDTFAQPHRIVELPDDLRNRLKGHFVKYTSVFAPNGKPIHFLAMDGWSDDRILRARKVLEHFLTDTPHRKFGDKTELANEMANNHATMVLLNHNRDMGRVMPVLERSNLACQDLRANESPYEGEDDYMLHETRDAAYEEVFHLVHGKGLIFVMKDYDREIRRLAKIATDTDLWNYDEPNMPGNHFEYVICVIDNYLDLWKTNPTKMEGRRLSPQRSGESFNGEYKAEDRASTFVADPEGFRMVEKFNPEHIAYTAELPVGFSGLFSIAADGGHRYSEKAKHLLNVTARGEEQVQLTGNVNNNRLVGNDADNVLTGNGGDDSIFGGPGKDTAVFRGKRSEYTIRRSGDLVEVHDSVVNRDGYDVLSGVEVLKFSDETFEK